MPRMDYIRHVRVYFANGRDPVDIVTSAADMLAMPANAGTLRDELEIYHHALLRLHVDGVPADFDTFAPMLAGVEVGDNGAGVDVDPTRSAPSDA